MFLKANTTSNIVTSRFLTPLYPDTTSSCVRWYMYVENQAILHVRTYAYGTLNPTILYTHIGSNGKQWKLAQTTVRSGAPYHVAFEGVLNNTVDILDSIAIDDVSIESGACDAVGTCDFENGLCGYQNLPADFNWKRTSYNIEIISAPITDHTTNTRAGFYLFMDRLQSSGRKARIESELIPNDIRCVSFYYYIDGTQGAQLNVYVRDPRSDTYKQLWSTDQAHGKYWVQQEISVLRNMTVNGTSVFTVVYEAVSGQRTGGMKKKEDDFNEISCFLFGNL